MCYSTTKREKKEAEEKEAKEVQEEDEMEVKAKKTLVASRVLIVWL